MLSLARATVRPLPTAVGVSSLGGVVSAGAAPTPSGTVALASFTTILEPSEYVSDEGIVITGMLA